ncbi:MAG: ribonuclease HII [Nitrospirota bacterium]
MLTHERELVASGYATLAGIDEAGRGPLAGPVVAAAVILPLSRPIPGVRDSKTVPPPERERLHYEIIGRALAVGVGVVGVREIERVNIFRATIQAMEQAIRCLSVQPDALLIDAIALREVLLPQRAIIRGDASSYLIAAASIVAKVTRDRLVADYDVRYPGYEFSRHKGYGTPAHLDRLSTLGPTPVHRRTFHRVRPEAPA